MTNDDRNGVSAEPEKINPEEQLPDRDGLTLNLIDILPYLPVAWLAYRCARDGLVILLRNKNKNEKLAQNRSRFHSRSHERAHHRTDGNRTAAGRCKKRRG
ncbi:hypothetical protein FML15_12520 [Klebsiella michiganensis]|nr:hypothetical protein [Klebsiella michiganensis]MCU7509548.1 hypothetical protein [Klebsiella quasipneumoniae]